MNEIFEEAKRRAEQRAAMASERPGRVQVGFKWKNGILNKGIHKSWKDYIDVCIQDVTDEMEEKAAEERDREQCEEKQAERQNGCGARHCELLIVAHENGLNHGRPWVADGYTIDRHSIHPSWEGELVCYVYE